MSASAGTGPCGSVQYLQAYAEQYLQAYAELLLCAASGDVHRVQELCEQYNIQLRDNFTCDYEQKTPLHVSAAEGQLSMVRWLLGAQACSPNPVDRYACTPLEYALLEDHLEVQGLLIQHGGKVFRKGTGLVDHTDVYRHSCHASVCSAQARSSAFADRLSFDQFWPPGSGSGGHAGPAGRPAPLMRKSLERNSSDCELRGLSLGSLIGRGSYAQVYKGRWRGATVAVKVLSHEGDRATKLSALHESMVCAKIAHPNVVTTYKVHVVRQPAAGNAAEDNPLASAQQRPSLPSCRASVGVGSPRDMVGSPRHARSCPSLDRCQSAEAASSAFARAARAAFLPIDDAALAVPRPVSGGAPAPAGLGKSISADEVELRDADAALLQREGSVAPTPSRGGSLHVERAALPSPFEATLERALSARTGSAAGAGTSTGAGASSGTESAVERLARRISVDLFDSATGSRHGSCTLSGELSMDQDECSLGMFLGGGAEGWGADAPGGPQGTHGSSDGFVKSLLVMEYADLGTLHAHLLAGRLRGDLVAILLCLLDVAAGMAYLHGIGIMHSDLKGANVLLKNRRPSPDNPRGYTCKIADFGLSRVLEDDMTQVLTSRHGTVAYTAPETLHSGAMGTPADVYSFGMLMLELWTGELVHSGVHAHKVLLAVFSGQKPAIPANMPANYRALLERCWANKPDARPTFAEIRAQLQRMLAAARQLPLDSSPLALPQPAPLCSASETTPPPP